MKNAFLPQIWTVQFYFIFFQFHLMYVSYSLFVNVQYYLNYTSISMTFIAYLMVSFKTESSSESLIIVTIYYLNNYFFKTE